MNLWHFLLGIILIALCITGYFTFFSPQAKVRSTISAAAKAFRELQPSLPDFLCENFNQFGYRKRDAEQDWEEYRKDFSQAKIWYRINRISVKFHYAQAEVEVKAAVRYGGNYYMLVGEPFAYEKGQVFLVKMRSGRWCINRLRLPSFQRWIEQRSK